MRNGVLGGLIVILIALAWAALLGDRGEGPVAPSATPSATDLSPTPSVSPSPTPAFSPIGQSPTAGVAATSTPAQTPTPAATEEVAVTGVPRWMIPAGLMLLLLGAVTLWSAIRLSPR